MFCFYFECDFNYRNPLPNSNYGNNHTQITILDKEQNYLCRSILEAVNICNEKWLPIGCGTFHTV